jgi:hypothetical protein
MLLTASPGAGSPVIMSSTEKRLYVISSRRFGMVGRVHLITAASADEALAALGADAELVAKGLVTAPHDLGPVSFGADVYERLEEQMRHIDVYYHKGCIYWGKKGEANDTLWSSMQEL